MRQRHQDRAVQHKSHLFTAPSKGHSKGTFTFFGEDKLGLRRCGLYLVCLPAQKMTSLVGFLGLFQGCHVIRPPVIRLSPPLRRALKNVQREKEIQGIYYWHSPSICYYDVHPAKKCLYPYKVPSINLAMLSPSR